ncbi:MAG: hypothetical protein ABEI96_03100 [Haloarculaceae archaeon]
MDDQLAWLSTTLADHGVDYWIESGTLLTTYRSGRLTEYDDDVDVAVWAGDLDALDAALPAVERRGYDVQIRSYDGHRYKYQLLPTGTAADDRLVDVMIFRRAGGHAWTAQSRLRRDVPGLSTALDATSALFERYARSAAGRIEMTAWPTRLLTEVLTLWLPLEFVGRRRYDADLGLYTPRDVEPYLTFRYGDWETPVEEWSLTDDNAVYRRDPESLFDEADPEPNAPSPTPDPTGGNPERLVGEN